jgi:hypothetical protein
MPDVHEWRSERREKFKILHRDNFTCRYCGARPGSKDLEVDHLIPRSRFGSDETCNLVAACVTCNRRKSDTIIFPADMIERDDANEGWKIHRSFGEWAVKFNDEMVFIESEWEWGFDVTRLITEPDFMQYHIPDKLRFWCDERPQTARDFVACLQYVWRMITLPAWE